METKLLGHDQNDVLALKKTLQSIWVKNQHDTKLIFALFKGTCKAITLKLAEKQGEQTFLQMGQFFSGGRFYGAVRVFKVNIWSKIVYRL